ncbi:hypothetical protein ScalyP_jg8772 [Parmales sp. scaly parma]|nr:hypothetical protein ScalyP_jg8772 [Parmales sp. scaly parma]
MQVFATALYMALLCSASADYTLSGTILPPPSTLNSIEPPSSSYKLSLNGAEHTTFSASSTGSFAFVDLTPGVYALQVDSVTGDFASKSTDEDNFMFPFIKIQVSSDSTAKCLLYYYLGGEMTNINCENVKLPAMSRVSFFDKRRPFSLMGLFKNPMLLMMLFGAGMTYMMPKMMEGMDPEQKAQMEKQMAMQSDPMAMMKEMFSGGEEEPAAEAKTKKLGNSKKHR